MPHADPEVRKRYMREWRENNYERVRELNRDYAAKNGDHIRALKSRWRERNRDKLRCLGRLDYQKHLEQRKAKHKEYNRNHKTQMAEYGRKHRQSQTHRDWRAKNRDRLRENSNEYRRTSPVYKEWLEINRDKILVSNKHWRDTSPAYAKWKEANRDKIRSRALNKYHESRDFYNEYQRDYNILKPRRAAIFIKWELCEKICYICGNPISDVKSIWVDHVIAVTRGGSNHIDNLMPTHRGCNVRKGNKLNYPVARPDLVESTLGKVNTYPLKPARNGGTAVARERSYRKSRANSIRTTREAGMANG